MKQFSMFVTLAAASGGSAKKIFLTGTQDRKMKLATVSGGLVSSWSYEGRIVSPSMRNRPASSIDFSCADILSRSDSLVDAKPKARATCRTVSASLIPQ